MVSIRTLMTLIVFSLVFSVGFAASATTPDGETPAEETVCGDLVGAAFGLCNAYCEAMDCDSDEPQASVKTCEKVLDNFEKQTDGMVDMPCELEPICGETQLICGAHEVTSPDGDPCCTLTCPDPTNCSDCFTDLVCIFGTGDPPPPIECLRLRRGDRCTVTGLDGICVDNIPPDDNLECVPELQAPCSIRTFCGGECTGEDRDVGTCVDLSAGGQGCLCLSGGA